MTHADSPRRLGRTELIVGPLAFGGAPIGLLQTGFAEVRQLLNELLDGGVNLLDTAASYAGSEQAIRGAVGHRRDEFVLTTKCGRKLDDMPAAAWSAHNVAQTVDRSLSRLGTDRIDIMFLHSCPLGVLKRGEALQALVEAKRQGKILHAGYAGDGPAVTYAAGLPEIEVVMMTGNFCDRANLREPLHAALAHDVGVIAKRPLANAAWDPSLQRGVYRDYARPYAQRFAAIGLTLDTIQDADPTIVDWADAVLRFIIGIEGVSAAVVGTTSRRNAVRNLVAASRGPLNPDVTMLMQQAYETAQHSTPEPWPALE